MIWDLSLKIPPFHAIYNRAYQKHYILVSYCEKFFPSLTVMSSFGIVVLSLRARMLLLNYMTIYMNAERKMKTIRLQMISFSEHFCVKWYDLHVIGV